jgi:inorganic pyrophosphatase
MFEGNLNELNKIFLKNKKKFFFKNYKNIRKKKVKKLGGEDRGRTGGLLEVRFQHFCF